jgi:hypothetical protein
MDDGASAQTAPGLANTLVHDIARIMTPANVPFDLTGIAH